MKWCRQNQEEGTKMHAEKPPVHKGVHNVHTPFGRTKSEERSLPGSQEQPSAEDPRK